MGHRAIVGSNLQAIWHVLAASATGLVALPLLFSSDLEVGGVRAWLWLAGTVLIGLWILLPGPALARGLARLLTRLPGQSQHPDGAPLQSLDVSRWLLAVGYVVLLQNLLRRPLVAAFGATSEPLSAEAMFAIVALLVLLVILAWLHQVGKPLIEGLTRVGLDVVLATSGSEVHAAPPKPPSQASVIAVLAPDEASTAEKTLAGQTQPAATRQGGHRRSIA